MPLQFEKVAGGMTVTEGAVWDGQALLFADIGACRIMRYDPHTGQCSVYRTDTRHANGLRMDAQGRIYACEGSGRAITRYEKDGSVTILADRFEGKRLNSPNDIAIDTKGRIWFTDPRYEAAPVYGDHPGTLELDHQSVFRLDPAVGGKYAIHRVTFDTTKPNGLLVSPDEKMLYVAQSDYAAGSLRQLRAYPIKRDGTLGKHVVLHDFGAHRGIDGMKLDSEGNIVATAGYRQSGPGPMIYVFAPDGKVLEMNPFPEDRPTNCTFGDADLQTLYVTNMPGSLYRARTQRKGLVVAGIR
jgi:gluconolactonase